MKTIFIADAHLKGLDDPFQASLARFLDSIEADRLVVLGDLFDFWTGFSGVVYQRYVPLLESMLRLKQRGTRITYLEGNHDFSMGWFFTDELGADVHAEGCTMELDGRKTYLAHGDTIDESIGYGAWRWFLRSPIFTAVKTVTTPGFVLKVADALSHGSRKYNNKGEMIERRLRLFAKRKILAGYDVVVLAHSHVAGISEVGDGERTGTYANPGGWMGQQSYLVLEDGEFTLERYEG